MLTPINLDTSAKLSKVDSRVEKGIIGLVFFLKGGFFLKAILGLNTGSSHLFG